MDYVYLWSLLPWLREARWQDREMVIHVDVSLTRVALVRYHPRKVASASDLLVVVVMAVLGQEPVPIVNLARVSASVLGPVLVVVHLETL